MLRRGEGHADAVTQPTATADEKRLIDRLLAFSDTIFAFALTLLVLDLRPPDAGAADWDSVALEKLGAFTLSFALVAVFWAGHMSATRRLARFDWLTLWFNLLVLFAVVLTPFGTSLLGSALDPAEAWRAYSLVIIATSGAQALLSLVLFRDRGRLVGGATIRERFSRFLRAASAGVAFTASVLLIEAGRLDLAQWSWLLIAPILAFAAVIAPRQKQ